MTVTGPLSEYLSAFEKADEAFLSYYYFDSNKNVLQKEFTRGEFLILAQQAAAVIRQAGLQQGDRIIHCFGANDYHDLAFRLGAVMTGTVPVTVNWQADTYERICYKIELTDPKLILFNQDFDHNVASRIKDAHSAITCYDVENLDDATCSEIENEPVELSPEDTRVVIFTSGTTGNPKGVKLPYRAYETNRNTFETMLAIGDDEEVGFLVVNPMHHTNSTAITDWALRRAGARLHLVQRYSTRYWNILIDVAGRQFDHIVAPTVARHFDFLDNLASKNQLPVELSVLRGAMSKINFLIGSAPVGPTTVERLEKYAGRLPTVRFGSTETCLQVIGIPASIDEEHRLTIFKRGWYHHYNEQPLVGYYIGRPTAPYTEARIVESIDRNDPNYLKDCPEGKPGYLITRGGNLMTGYVKNPDATAEVFHDGGWYTGLKDICFALRHKEDKELDYFWQGRDSFLMIRGGANYAYDQINTELTDFIEKEYQLEKQDFEVAVIGLRIESEHEDDCCVTIELKTDVGKVAQGKLQETFIAEAKKSVSKGAKPTYLRFGSIPKNFKGALLVPELKKAYNDFLGNA